jgi:DNA-binding Lrp family transcriptional regulator
MSEEMDEKDADILEMLRKDSRTPMGQIGDSLGISKATVSRRIARMEEDKVITCHSLELDPSKLNVLRSLLGIQVIGSSIPLVIENLSKQKEIRYIYKAFGDHHLVCEVYTKDVNELYSMIQSVLLDNPSIKSIEVDALVERVSVNENADIQLYRTIKLQK